MRMYTMIDSDAKLADLQSQWKEKGISIVAMDFEGRQHIGHRFQRIEPDINGEIGVSCLPLNTDYTAHLFGIFHFFTRLVAR